MSDFIQRSAELILRLFEVRRELSMLDARDWFVSSFHPRDPKDVLDAWLGRESARYQLVTTYWEMAAAFVLQGAIDADLFHASNTEYVAVYAKLEPFLAEARLRAGVPDYLLNLEQLVTTMPNAATKLEEARRYLKIKAREAGVVSEE
jgi:hypothetical protein